MENRVEWAWPLSAIADGKPLKFIARGLVREWFWPWYTGIWKICKAIEFVGLFECMTWALRGSEVHTIGTTRWVEWRATELTVELYVHGWPAHKSAPEFWPWGVSEGWRID